MNPKNSRFVISTLAILMVSSLALAVFLLFNFFSAPAAAGQQKAVLSDTTGSAAEQAADSANKNASVQQDNTAATAEQAASVQQDNTAVTAEQDASVRQDAAQIVASMTLKQKIGQMIMPAMRSWQGQDVTTLNSKQQAAIAELGFGGIILFSENTAETAQIVKLTAAMQQAAEKGRQLPLFIAVDQEGGIVTRLQSGTSMPGNMALAATGSVKLASQSAAVIGSELKALGINLDFAPVVDVNSNPANPVIGVRSFADDPQLTAKFAAAYINGLESTGTIAAVKHFPGHGDTAVDSHLGLPLVAKNYEQLAASDLIPFKSAIDNGIDWVMTAHIQYPQIETTTYTSRLDGQKVYLPATLSAALINDVLRTRLGYDGIVSTDAMEMAALVDNFGRRDTARLAINAGVDVLLMPVALDSPQGLKDMRRYINDIAAMVKSGEIAEATVDASAERIVRLKLARGIINAGPAEKTAAEKVTSALAVVGSEANREIERTIADRAVTLLRNKDDLLPLQPQENESVLLLGSSQYELYALPYGVQRLIDEGLLPRSLKIQTLCYAEGENMAEIKKAVADCNYVITTSKLLEEAELAPTAWKTASVAEIIEYAHAAGRQIVVVSIRNPYDAARYPEADALLAVYNSLAPDGLDDAGSFIGSYGPNIPAAMDIIFGKTTPSGTLPVNIRQIGTDYKYTDEILYERGFGIIGFPAGTAIKIYMLSCSLAVLVIAAVLLGRKTLRSIKNKKSTPAKADLSA